MAALGVFTEWSVRGPESVILSVWHSSQLLAQVKCAPRATCTRPGELRKGCVRKASVLAAGGFRSGRPCLPVVSSHASFRRRRRNLLLHHVSLAGHRLCPLSPPPLGYVCQRKISSLGKHAAIVVEILITWSLGSAFTGVFSQELGGEAVKGVV